MWVLYVNLNDDPLKSNCFADCQLHRTPKIVKMEGCTIGTTLLKMDLTVAMLTVHGAINRWHQS